MTSRTRKSSIRRFAAVVGAVGALVMSSGIVLLATAPGAQAAPDDKWFVCKYVDTPGEPEVLQTGTNPISVNESAIKVSPVVAGASFADGQGRSVVLGPDNTQPGPQDDPGPEACAPPSENITIVVDVVFTDPSCDNDNVASYEVTGDTDNATVEESTAPEPGAEVTVTATANEGYAFAGGLPTYSETHTFGDAEDCSEPPVVEPPVVEPPVVEPPAVTPTVVHAGLVGAQDNSRTEQGIALLASGLLLMVAAGGLARPRTARR